MAPILGTSAQVCREFMKSNMSNLHSEKIIETFPFLKSVIRESKTTPSISSLLTKIPKGKTVFREGDECSGIAFILSGTIRIYKTAENGREITLYRIKTGESCILSISCVFSHKPFVAFADVEEECELLLVPPNLFRHWMSNNEQLTEWVFGLLANRLGSVLLTVEEVAFKRVDGRITDFLLHAKKTTPGNVLVTHQQLATELGTSREVVSRILKDFEKKGLISIHRGSIQIESIDQLKKYTGNVT